ncbi:MAG TPA: heavy metal-responsive transcriptional regulator [Pyrinomonadaceae bacterium]|nr:heavy metal-responsive transcriptional regulator [Pyrinomonadaceae bacterium]
MKSANSEIQSTQPMLAGGAAKELGIGIQTLHFYEQQGLIPQPPRAASGYRLYTTAIMERVRFVRKAQALGFSLEEIKEILGLAQKGTSPCGRVQAALAEKLLEVDRRLKELADFRSELAALIEQSKDKDFIQICIRCGKGTQNKRQSPRLFSIFL